MAYNAPRVAMARNPGAILTGAILQEAAMALIPAIIIIGAILALVYHLERTNPS
jgi:hypothetical protein